MNGIIKSCFLLLLSILVLACGQPKKKKQVEQIPDKLQELKEQFIEQRFGMFVCYNIMSYGAAWSEANYPIDSFNPQKLDCNQWAEAAVSAGMKLGILTTKHHEGFCLWDSQYTDYDVASTPYKKDIVRQFVDAFRTHGLGVGLYFSIADQTHGIVKGEITPEKLELVMGQIRELLTNYGKIDYFVLDGWNWSMGHKEVPYHKIRQLIRDLQPDCLVTDHTHLQAPYHVDIPYFEGPFGAFPPEGNTMASALGHCSVKGNGWFWSEETPNGLKEGENASTIVEKLRTCESRYCNFMLNCMPNREGLLDPIYIDLLSKIGRQWQPDSTRPVLPDQGPQIWETLPFAQVTASSGNADYLWDGTKIAGKNYYDWEAEPGFPQEIIMDFGAQQKNVSVLTIVHKHRCKPGPEMPLKEGNILRYRLYQGSDGVTFKWVADPVEIRRDGYISIGFKPTNARYLKLTIMDAVGGRAVINELEAGKRYFGE